MGDIFIRLIVQKGDFNKNTNDLHIVIVSCSISKDDDIRKTIKTLKCNRVLRLNKDKEEIEYEGEIFISVYYDEGNFGWVAKRLIAKVDESTEKYTIMYDGLTHDEVHIVGTIIGESLTLTDEESKACTHTIINRRDCPYEWPGWSLKQICNPRHYRGINSDAYADFIEYYNSGRSIGYEGSQGESWNYEQKINAIFPVIIECEEDFTHNAVYFAGGRDESIHGIEVLTDRGFVHRFFKHKEDI